MAAPSSSSVLIQETQPQADLLPTKRGEFGFRESLYVEAAEDITGTDHTESLPARHPADRDIPQSPAAPGISSSTASSASPSPPSNPLRAFFEFKKFRKSGVRLSIIVLLVSQSAFLLITTALWVVLVKLGVVVSTVALLIHVVFATATIFQVVFLHRTVFMLYAERYAALHPGEAMRSTSLHPDHPPSRLAPWNRPPLPSYSAVLVNSGISTGDVEDNRIAIPPPPAYGITRGSTLVFSGFISEDLRSESRRVRAERGERLSDMSQKTASRPVSYVSSSEVEARCDMTRATILWETLCRLQSAEASTRRS